jgi:hypothetical protein
LISVNLSCLSSCGVGKHTQLKDSVNIATRDSIIIKDSVRVIDSVIYIQLPKEKVMDIIQQIDTSKLETSLAKSIAYVDTNSLMIIHSLENKDTVISERIVYQERFIEKEKIVYRDTIETREIPVEVIVEKTKYPKSYWYLLGFAILVVGLTAIRLYLKFKKV